VILALRGDEKPPGEVALCADLRERFSQNRLFRRSIENQGERQCPRGGGGTSHWQEITDARCLRSYQNPRKGA